MRDVTPDELGGSSKTAVVIGPFGSSLKTSDFTDGGVPLVFVRDIRAGDFSKPRAFVSEEKARELRAHIAIPGDLVVTKMGDPPGDVAIYDGRVPAVITADCIRLRPARGYDTRYLLHAFKTPRVRQQVLDITSGAAHKKVSLERFRHRVAVPVPSLPEQRRIAAILDHVDALHARRRQVLTHLDSLTQSIFNDMFGAAAFTSVPLGSIVDFYSGGTPPKARKDYWEGDLPWFSAKDLKAPDLWDSQDHIASTVTQETSLKLLPPDTITMVVRGMILAHTVPVTTVRVPATINQDLKALMPKADVDVDYLSAAIRARFTWILARVSTAAHGTKKLESTVLESIPVPDADSRLQLAFAARVAQVNAQRATVSRAIATDEELFASLQSRAFRGEL